MERQQLLNLLGPQARKAFERAKRLAVAKGGALTPIHLLVALLEELPGERSEELISLRRIVSDQLSFSQPAGAGSITVTRETQEAIAEAGRLAGQDAATVQPLHLLKALLKSASARAALGDTLKYENAVTSWYQPARDSAGGGVEGQAGGAVAARPDQPKLTGALSEFCIDLAERALLESTHPFVGRERELTAVLETLCRKLKNNPLLIGKPGVGKTALVCAVAARLAGKDVPARLRGKRILEVSRIRLLADVKFAGDVEKRLERLIAEVRASGNLILFFDEIHTLLGAGGAGGTGDIANLLKSSLSKGEVTCIGATTLAEYYKYIARDEALARRFSTITIEEPSSEETHRILTQSRGAFEDHHGLRIDEDVIRLIVEMSDRYLHSRTFPDKAFDLLDRAGAKATMAGHEQLTRECVTGTLSEITGLPLEIMDEDPAERLERLEAFLNAAVPGQQAAARDVARVARIAKLKLELRPEQPDGVFLFVGPKAVGKQEMAEALARFLYGSVNKMIDFDMSQFSEPHSISRLVGAEPGYVGYGDRSGLLSKAVEDSPHSVLYFRNIDLAHAVVQQFLGEAFERGRFTDSTGARLSLSNTTVIMTLSLTGETGKPAQVGFFANVEEEPERRSGSGSRPLPSRIAESLAATVDEVIEFQTLDEEATHRIIRERIEALRSRLEMVQPVAVTVTAEVAAFFAERLGSESKSLAHLERLWQETVVMPFTRLQIARQAGAAARVRVLISIKDGCVHVDVE